MTGPHVAIDARLWDAWWTGTSAYLRGMTRALSALDWGARCTVVTCAEGLSGPPQDRDDWQVLLLAEPHLMEPVWEQITLPTDLAARRVDVLFAPGGIVPLARDFAAVPVVHDLGFLHHPGFYDEGLRTYLTKWVRLACETAEAIVCNSEFTRRSVAETYDVEPERCTTVCPAPDAIFSADQSVVERRHVAERFGLDRPFILTVSSGGPNKNLPAALQVMARLWAAEPQLDLLFAVVGDARGIDIAELTGGVARARIRMVGRVSNEDLAILYRTAEVFFFPSLYEGFGLPPIEAMACGVPVVASDRGALPEVLGEAAVLCDPEDNEEMAERMREVLTDSALSDGLRRRGLENVKRYNWGESARRLTDVFAEAADTR